jgi:hypothetical protein
MTRGVKLFVGCFLSVSFLGGVVASFSAPPSFFWWAFLGSLGAGVGAICLFIFPMTRKPFARVYKHEDWVIDARGVQFPVLIILDKDHGMGVRPDLAFRQGDYVFPWTADAKGNITVVCNNESELVNRSADRGFERGW